MLLSSAINGLVDKSLKLTSCGAPGNKLLFVAETVLNSPFNTAFTMEVFQSTGTPLYIAQKAIEFASGHCKWRMRESGSGTIVQDWIQLY